MNADKLTGHCVKRRRLKPAASPHLWAALNLVVIALVVAGGVAVTSQWRQTISLRGEVRLLQLEAGELERLRAENKRLRGQQISAAELESLRADHAALPRLRAEIEALNTSVPAVKP